MTPLEWEKHKIDDLYRKRDELLRRERYVEADLVMDRIREREARLPQPMSKMVSSEELTQMGIIPLLIEAHLAADFLTAIAYAVADICKEHGFEEVFFPKDLKDLISKSEAFASKLMELCPHLTEMLTDNETVNEAVHKKYMSYIEQRSKKCNMKEKTPPN